MIVLIENKGEAPRFDRGMVTDCFLSCIVLVNLISRTALSLEEMKSSWPTIYLIQRIWWYEAEYLIVARKKRSIPSIKVETFQNVAISDTSVPDLTDGCSGALDFYRFQK